jgi:hypothetical protein
MQYVRNKIERNTDDVEELVHGTVLGDMMEVVIWEGLDTKPISGFMHEVCYNILGCR